MKIFLVVGSMFPFDRLVKAVDKWALNWENIKVIGQIGDSQYVPENLVFYKSLSANDFNKCFSESDLIISHAGMGVILKSLMENKPIIIIPRRLQYKELTTDHQLATAKALNKMNYVHVAMNIEELLNFLEKPYEIPSKHTIGKYASDDLLNSLREFIRNC